MDNSKKAQNIRRIVIIILLAIFALTAIYFLVVAFGDSPYEGLNRIEAMSDNSDVLFIDNKNNLTLKFSNTDDSFYLTDNSDSTTFSLNTLRGFGSLYVLLYETGDDDMKFTGTMYISSDGESIIFIYDSWKYKKSSFNLITERG